jgi:hypothetical protein
MVQSRAASDSLPPLPNDPTGPFPSRAGIAIRNRLEAHVQKKKPGTKPGFKGSGNEPYQAGAWMFDACLPFGPCTTSKVTF